MRTKVTKEKLERVVALWPTKSVAEIANEVEVSSSVLLSWVVALRKELRSLQADVDAIFPRRQRANVIRQFAQELADKS